MRLSPILFVCLALMMLGCQTTHPAPHPDEPAPPSPTFWLSGTIPNPGPRPLQPGETVSMALATLNNPASSSNTLVLVRISPEGKTRELIQLDPHGNLTNPKQDYVLRDWDVMVFGGASNTTPPVSRPSQPMQRGPQN